MSKADETFFTSIGCMDGRVQDPIGHFGQKLFGAEYPDTITEAGLVGLLGKDSVEQSLLESIKKKVLISVEKHHSKGIIVHGHEECAGNPVDDRQHKEEILKTAKLIQTFVPADITVIPVFVKRCPSASSGLKQNEWMVEKL